MVLDKTMSFINYNYYFWRQIEGENENMVENGQATSTFESRGTKITSNG